MSRKLKAVIAGVALAGAAALPAIAGTTGDDGAEDRTGDVPITGTDLERASEVALDHLGGGSVTGTEVEDEESYYEVEVTRADGSQVDVQLDEQFNVVGSEADGSAEED